MIIAVDLDGTVVDLISGWREHYQSTFGKELSPPRRWGFLGDLPKRERESMRDYLETPGLFESLPYMEGAQMALRALQKMGHQLYFVTSPAGPESAKGKITWCQREWPNIPCVLLHDKNRFHADVIIDDHPKHAECFTLALGLRQTWNEDYEDCYLALCDDWREILNRISFIDKLDERGYV